MAMAKQKKGSRKTRSVDPLSTMNHKPNIFSPPGTPIIERTVGELVAERPGRSRIFQAFDIDFCCQGARTVREACERKGIPSKAVIEQLEAELAGEAGSAQNPAELPPVELAEYIVETHHGFLRQELPRLHALSERVAHVHGAHKPSLVEIFHLFTRLEAELAGHMMKEEQILFPAITAMSRGEQASESLDQPIHCMVHEHEQAGAALARLRELSHDFQPPVDACNKYRALFAGLRDLEEDMHKHIHLENAVLFPAARALAAERN
jgi:regulator of cell morphogenesis and NO signaling